MSLRFLVSAGSVIAGFLLFSFLMHTRYAPGPHAVYFTHEGKIDFKAEKTYWETEIPRTGSASAYTELADSIVMLTELQRHTVAHAFGEALYKTEGLPGLTTCDSRFGQGCVHSFLGAAVQDYGIAGGLPGLSEQCLNEKDPVDKRSCEHAIGHGILSYVGYTLPDLKRSLTACETLGDRANLDIGCLGGAFMEYNERIMLRADDAPMRSLTETSRYEPCNDVAEKYLATCMFAQPFWWGAMLKRLPESRPENTYATIARYCRGTAALYPQTTHACFEGMGYAIPLFTNLDARATADACAAAGDHAAERIACWSWALSQLKKTEREEYAPRVCAGLEGVEKTYCQTHNLDIVDLSADRVVL